jgi:hypothetical protein
MKRRRSGGAAAAWMAAALLTLWSATAQAATCDELRTQLRDNLAEQDADKAQGVTDLVVSTRILAIRAQIWANGCDDKAAPPNPNNPYAGIPESVVDVLENQKKEDPAGHERRLRDVQRQFQPAQPPPTAPASTPSPDEVDALDLPGEIKEILKRLRKEDPDRYKEAMKGFPPVAPSSSTTTLAPLLPLPPLGLDAPVPVPDDRSRTAVVPPAPLPIAPLNTPPLEATPPKRATPQPLPVTPTGIPASPDRGLKKITTICQQGPEARDDPQNTPYKCRKVDHVCESGTKGPNCKPWMHTTDTVVCSTWRARPEQGDTATCMPMDCRIPPNGLIAGGGDGGFCKPAIDPSYLGLRSAVLPVQPLPPPHIAPPPVGSDHVQPQSKKATPAKRRQPAPRKHVNRRTPEQPAHTFDAATASALIGIAIGAARGAGRSGGNRGGRSAPRSAPSGGHHR